MRKANFDKAMIWDLDGVIADTGPFHFRAWRELVEGKGRNYTKEDFQHGFGLRNDDILQSLFGKLEPEEIELLSRKKEEIFRSLIREDIKPLPGVLQLLGIAHKDGFGIGLASSAPIENVELILSSLGIDKYFDCIVTAGDVRKGKPDPEGFLIAAYRLGVEPSQCLVIEDATAGVEAAKTAGMKCLAVTNTHPRETLAGADLTIDSLEKINSENLRRLIAIA